MYAHHASNIIGLVLLVVGFMILAFSMLGLAVATFSLHKQVEEQDKTIKRLNKFAAPEASTD